MAKRKRLTPANPDFLGGPPETQSEASRLRAPIADVAADSSASAALQEVAGELTDARESGRLISRVALDQIDLGYLVRDRVAVNDEDMQALITSIRDRGQQAPIEVAVIGPGRYGLISGWRRCQAIAQVHADGEGDGSVLILQRTPEKASDAYRAMVEENEIRADLSYFERARIVVVSVEQGVFETHKKALQGLFTAASRPKRSKIGSFIPVVQKLGAHLRFPQAIGERLGLRLSRLLEMTDQIENGLIQSLNSTNVEISETEQAILIRWAAAIEKGGRSGKKKENKPSERRTPEVSQPRPDLLLRYDKGKNRLELIGEGVDENLRTALLAWLAGQDAPSS